MNLKIIQQLRSNDLIHERIEYIRLCNERDRYDYGSIEYTILCKQITDFSRRIRLTYTTGDCNLICMSFAPQEKSFLEAL